MCTNSWVRNKTGVSTQGVETNFIITEEFKLIPWNLKRAGRLNGPNK